jgi:hypothetical protein
MAPRFRVGDVARPDPVQYFDCGLALGRVIQGGPNSKFLAEFMSGPAVGLGIAFLLGDFDKRAVPEVLFGAFLPAGLEHAPAA